MGIMTEQKFSLAHATVQSNLYHPKALSYRECVTVILHASLKSMQLGHIQTLVQTRLL